MSPGETTLSPPFPQPCLVTDSYPVGTPSLLSLVAVPLLALDGLGITWAVRGGGRWPVWSVATPSSGSLLWISAQMAGLLCEEEVLEVDNVKYCGYCKYHFSKMVSASAHTQGCGHGAWARVRAGVGRTREERALHSKRDT